MAERDERVVGEQGEQGSAVGLSGADVQALSYFAMGVSSEGSIGGRNVAYEVRFAGSINAVTRRMSPVANSGYSLGTIQTDLGQHPEVAAEFVAAYQDWAGLDTVARPGWRLEPDLEADVIRDLMRTGNEIRAGNGLDLPVEIKSRLNEFLDSAEGISYVHGRDVAQINHLMRTGSSDEQGALAELQATTMYAQSSVEDQARLATIIVKLENQAGSRIYPRVLQGVRNGDLTTVEEVKSSLATRPKYIVDGVNHALAGAELFIRLRNAHPDNPIVGAWQSVIAEPLVNPATLQVNLAGAPIEAPGPDDEWREREMQYSVIKNLFLQPEVSRQFVAALDSGQSYTYGQPARAGPGFYVAGNDFVLWNSDGDGHACIGGAWSAVSRRDITRVNNPDGTVSLNIARDHGVVPMLHIDRKAPAEPREVIGSVRPELQEPDSALRADLLGRMFQSVSRHVRNLNDGHHIEMTDRQFDHAVEGISLDAMRSGMNDVTLLRFSVDRTAGQPSTGGNFIAWQGDPLDPATKWSVTIARDASGGQLEGVTQEFAVELERLRSQGSLLAQQESPRQSGPLL